MFFFSFIISKRYAHNFRVPASAGDRAAPFGLPCLPERVFAQSSGGLLLRKRSEAEVGLDNVHLGEELLGFLALDGGVDNDIVTCGLC